MSAPIAPVANSQPQQHSTDKKDIDIKNLEEVVKQINKAAEVNEQKQVELNDISSKYISVQGEISANNRNIAQLFAIKNKLETDILKARIALLEGASKSDEKSSK